jgi:hypothetical protein
LYQFSQSFALFFAVFQLFYVSFELLAFSLLMASFHMLLAFMLLLLLAPRAMVSAVTVCPAVADVSAVAMLLPESQP